MDTSELQEEKADTPMYVTDEGMVRFVKEEQDVKALEPMCCTPSSTVNKARL